MGKMRQVEQANKTSHSEKVEPAGLEKEGLQGEAIGSLLWVEDAPLVARRHSEGVGPWRQVAIISGTPGACLYPSVIIADETVAEARGPGRGQFGRGIGNLEISIPPDEGLAVHINGLTIHVNGLNHGCWRRFANPHQIRVDHCHARHGGEPDSAVASRDGRRIPARVALQGQESV